MISVSDGHNDVVRGLMERPGRRAGTCATRTGQGHPLTS